MESPADYLRKVSETVGRISPDALSRGGRRLRQAWEAGRTVFFCGNGGSHANATNGAMDFCKAAFSADGRRLKTFCLGDSIAALTAAANDFRYEEVFVKGMEGRFEPGDVLVALSGSGNSANVLKAADYARSHGGTVIALVGYDGGKLGEKADILLHVPIPDMQVSEDLHLVILHALLRSLIL